MTRKTWCHFIDEASGCLRLPASYYVHDVPTFNRPLICFIYFRMKSMGGSAILDIGIYLLQFAQFVFKDEPIKVSAHGELNEDGVDVVDTVILEYSNGRRAVLNAHAKLRLQNNATVVGDKGRATASTFVHRTPTPILYTL